MWIVPVVIVTLIYLNGANGQTRCRLGDDPITLNSWNGTFSSPEGDVLNKYPSQQHCEWKIKVSEGSRVRLTFVTFDLEDGFYPYGPQNMSCNDIVKVYETEDTLFSGCQLEGLGKSFESQGNVVNVLFHSDESTEKSGFFAVYEGVCDNNITKSGYIESPGYPGPPPDNVTCTWNVMSPDKQQIVYLRTDENDTMHSLPNCNSSLLNWRTTRDPKAKELCRADSKIVTMSDVQLSYTPRNGDTWVGRLYLDFSTSSACRRFCDHGFDCISSRGMNIGDYRCLCEAPYSGRNCEITENPCDAANNCSDVGDCIISADSVNYTCNCKTGYTGNQCEIELDPCQDFACLNGGVCQKQNATFALCDCPRGFEPPDCSPVPTLPPNTTASPGPCDSWPCQHGGTCVNDGPGGYTCTCLPEYTGAFCSILDGEAHCRTELDDVVGSAILWKDTLADFHDEQNCPTGSTGMAKRNCMRDEKSPTGGLWRRPDLSGCISPIMMHLAAQSRLLTQTGVEGDALYNVTRHLDHVTSTLVKGQGQSDLKPVMFPGDLLTASDVLGDIAVGVVNAKSVDEDPRALAQHFTSSIGNILHPTLLDVWKNARVHLVENKVTSVLASAKLFAENLVRRQQGAKVISRDVSSDLSRTLLGTAVDNVDLLVTEQSESNINWSPFLDKTQDGADTNYSSTIELPPDILNIARGDGTDRIVTFYTGRFKSVAELLSLKEHRYSRIEEKNTTKLLNSDIMSAEVLDLPKSAFSSLTRPVKITFALKEPTKRTDLKKNCVFMNMSATGPEDRWLNDGCYLEQVTSTHVTCACYHLTNFAVLLDVYDNAADLDRPNSAALSYISYIGGSLSILACVVVIAVFEYFRLSSDRVRIHEQLAVTIVAVQILFLLGVGRTTTDSATPKWACKTVAILLHYSMTALFCWMLVEGIHIYVLLVKVFERGSHLKKYCAIGWGIPFIVVAISVGVFFDNYGDGEVCWLDHERLLICFVPAVALVITINTVILVLVLRVMLKSLHSTTKANTEQQSSIRTSLKASAVLLPLLGLTWILGFLTVNTDDTKIMVYIFTYLFTICNSFQGVLFFVFHCLLNVDVHNAYERRYRQRRRAMSSLETTRKSSEVSTYLPDSTQQGKSTTKSNFSDISILHRKPSLSHNRFILFDNSHSSTPCRDPTLPFFDASSTHHPPSTMFEGLSHESDGQTTVFGEMQASDKDRIWRRYSCGHEPSEDFFITPTSSNNNRSNSINVLRRSPSFLSNSHNHSSDVTAFVNSMHGLLDTHSNSPSRPTRPTSVHFSEN